LVFHSSTITVMHGPINVSFLSYLLPNCWYLSTKLHSIALHRTVILIFMLPLTGMLMILSYHCVIVMD